MLKNDYLERMRPYQNDFSDSLNTVQTAESQNLKASFALEPLCDSSKRKKKIFRGNNEVR
jgi:hypothetical protein